MSKPEDSHCCEEAGGAVEQMLAVVRKHCAQNYVDRMANNRCCGKQGESVRLSFTNTRNTHTHTRGSLEKQKKKKVTASGDLTVLLVARGHELHTDSVNAARLT